MKTAVSLPDRLFRQADRLARKLKKSRSQLYAEAIAEYLTRHDPEAITAALDRLAERVDTGADALVVAAAAGTLRASEW